MMPMKTVYRMRLLAKIVLGQGNDRPSQNKDVVRPDQHFVWQFKAQVHCRAGQAAVRVGRPQSGKMDVAMSILIFQKSYMPASPYGDNGASGCGTVQVATLSYQLGLRMGGFNHIKQRLKLPIRDAASSVIADTPCDARDHPPDQDIIPWKALEAKLSQRYQVRATKCRRYTQIVHKVSIGRSVKVVWLCGRCVPSYSLSSP